MPLPDSTMNIKITTNTIIILFFMLPACQQEEDHSNSISKVHHVVVCWLKESGNNEACQNIIETSRRFSSIPGVIDVRAGKVINSEREIVDDSFDIAIYLSFENKQKLQEYLIHPIHKKAVDETLKPLVRKVIVYDFIE